MSLPDNTELSKDIAKALKAIDIVDELIHSITRRHIPDYPEATVAINKIDALLAAQAEHLLAEFEALVGEHENIIAEIDTLGIAHKLDKPVYTTYMLARNALRKELRQGINKIRTELK